MLHRLGASAVLAAVLAAGIQAAPDDPPANLLTGLTEGEVALKSGGPLAFGPQGILFIGDPQAALVYAVDTGDRTAPAGPDAKDKPKIEGIDEKIAGLLGIEGKDLQIKDLAVNPITGTTYLSVTRGKAATAVPVILSATRSGKLAELSLKKIKSAKAEIVGATSGKSRQEAITHLAYLKGKVIVAGLSNEDWASKLRAIPFPFDKTAKGTNVEIYHGAHGAFETRSPVRVFASYNIKGEDHILAAYQCTPLVRFPVTELKEGVKIKGTTVAELGNRNRPLSMIVYQKGGKDYVLMANSSRGMMKIALEGITDIKGITKKVGDTAGLKYETIKELSGVMKLDAFDKDNALVLTREGGKTTLKTVALP